jgi:NitT/TauT family transport system substrate-binding protein
MAVLVMSALVSLSTVSQAQESFTVGMSWLFTGRHAWYFAALDKGYYGEVGLKVALERGHGGGATAKKLAVKSIQFAELDAATLILSRSQGVNVKLLSVHLRKNPFGVFALKGKGITRPKDLEGRTLGAPQIDVVRIFFPAYAQLAGIDEQKVKWETMDATASIPSLVAGKIDATVGFVDTFGGALKARGVDFVTLAYPDVGFALYGSGIAVSDELVKEKPEVVRRYVRATNRGVAWTIQNRKEALAILLKYQPTLDPKVMETQLALTLPLLGDPKAPGPEGKIGWMREDAMQATLALVSKYMRLERPVALNEVYTNEFMD